MRRIMIVALTALLGAGSLVHTGAASAAPVYEYSGYAGGSAVKVLGGVVRSDLTSASGVSGTTYPASQANQLAGVDLPGLLSVGAIETSASADRPSSDQQRQTSVASTAAVNLLDGLITADAVTSTSTATLTAGTLSGSSASELVNLRVLGTHVPIAAPKNFRLQIPGVASVTLNYSSTTVTGTSVTTEGAAIKVTLLEGRGGSPIGTTILISPTYASFGEVVPGATPVSGKAYATRVAANVGPGTAGFGPSALAQVPLGGTGGQSLFNSTLAVEIPKVVSVGVVESEVSATSVPVTGDVTTQSRLARISLLNGLVTADAVNTSAHVVKAADGTITSTPQTEVVNLRVLGIPIAIKTGQQRTLSVLGLATITVNKVTRSPNGIAVTGLELALHAPLGPLATNAVVEVAHADAYVG